jgi:hypothetical protein
MIAKWSSFGNLFLWEMLPTLSDDKYFSNPQGKGKQTAILTIQTLFLFRFEWIHLKETMSDGHSQIVAKGFVESQLRDL